MRSDAYHRPTGIATIPRPKTDLFWSFGREPKHVLGYVDTKARVEDRDGMIDLAAYFGLFLAALAAATILPMQSEAVLVGMLLTESYPVLALVTVASLGNVLGSLANWGLGRWLDHFRHRSWFPVGDRAMERAQGWYRRYGRWSLLASWLPIVGDPITVVAGVLREPLPTFLLLVAIAKIGRYVALAMATTSLAS